MVFQILKISTFMKYCFTTNLVFTKYTIINPGAIWEETGVSCISMTYYKRTVKGEHEEQFS